MKRSGSGAGSESVSQRCGSEDPDPYQNVMDPKHCHKFTNFLWLFEPEFGYSRHLKKLEFYDDSKTVEKTN